MKIAKVQSFLLSYPFATPIKLPFHGGERTILKRDAMFTRIETSNGLAGYAPGAASEKAHQTIQTVVAPFLEGRVLSDPDALRVQFMQGPGRDGEIAKLYCAVEVALYDLAAKAHGIPMSELLGGRVRDRIRLYGSAGMYQPPAGYAEEAAAIAALGYRGYKMRPALGPDADLEAVRLMRDAVGPDVDLMVDAHSWWRMGDNSYSYETVERLAGEMGRFGIAWLEEPMPPDDHEAYIRLKEKDLVPLASGEHEPNEDRFLDLIGSESVDYVQMDVCCQGGFAMARRLFGAIARHEQRFAFHSWGTALEVLAAAHLGVCWPDTVVEWLEYPIYSTRTLRSMYEFPLAAEILKEPLAIEDGNLIVPRGAGLGIDVDESVVDRYPWIPGPWSYFRTDSPAETWAVTSDHSVKWEGKG
ncbi:MAG: mandelate racemase/muconate lactonizing enzyme family protein [Bryobacterales bacterium]|nr:mandelate racemase/muconate lactonizing enzyme family protein [Bryobacterales bacterium]